MLSLDPRYHFIDIISANLALGKTATHNPNGQAAAKASLAVDGDISTDFAAGSCSQTGSGGAGSVWWKVDLQKTFVIAKVELHGSDCCSE